MATSSFFVLLALFFAITGMPRVFDTSRYYRPAGQIEAVPRGWFSTTPRLNEVSFHAGQTITIHQQAGNTQTSMTGLTFQRSSEQHCYWFQSDHGVNSLRIENGCGTGQYLTARVTNAGSDQVIRFGVGRPLSNFEPILATSDCRTCEELPEFKEVSDFSAIRTAGISKLLLSFLSLVFAWIAWIGIPVFIGYVYNVYYWVLPSHRGNTIRQEFENAKSGHSFNAQSTSAYDHPSENAFRRQQDIDDMNNLTALIRHETERLRALEAKLRSERKNDHFERERLIKEYEEAVARVKELQEEAAKNKAVG